MAVVNVNTVKQELQDIARKQQTTGYLTAAKFNRYAAQAQREECLSQREKYESGEQSSDAFSLLKKSTQVNIDSSGYFAKPSDYMFYDVSEVVSYAKDLNDNYGQIVKPLRFMSSAEWSVKKSNQFERPTKVRPIAVETATGFNVYPINPFRVVLHYIAIPADPVWGFTMVDGREVYSSGTSTQFSLPDYLTNNIIWRIARYMGLTVAQPDLVQVSAQMINIEKKEP